MSVRVMSEAMDKLLPATPVRTVTRAEARWHGYSEQQKRILIVDWLRRQNDLEGWVGDALAELQPTQIVECFLRGDDAQLGALVRQALLDFIGDAITKDDDYWRSL